MKTITATGMLLILLAGCSSAQKARREEREKMVQARGVYCDFVSESDFKDVDVELNIRLAKKCNASKPFSIAGYKRVSENPGVLYCCNSEGVVDAESSAAKPAPTTGGAASGKQGE